MATATRANEERTDEFGIERANADEPGAIDKYREKWPWFDHIMRMQDRYAKFGGNQYAAGITYFSVLSLFPLLMLVLGIAAIVLANRPEVLSDLQTTITDSVDGSLSETINEIMNTAIEQRAAILSIGGLTALWSGLGWMFNLRYGMSKMWQYPVVGENFIVAKLKDLVGLIGLLLALIVAFGVTAVGSSGLTMSILEALNLDGIPGITVIARLVAIAVGLVANFLVFFWIQKYLPRGEVPVKAALKASLIGAVAFEIFKQLGSVFFSNALNNPAGATFGPIIGIMVLFYFVWRIVLYCAAWAATTQEALMVAKTPTPPPAIIRVRAPEKPVRDDRTSSGLGKGAAVGVASAAVLSILGMFRGK